MALVGGLDLLLLHLASASTAQRAEMTHAAPTTEDDAVDFLTTWETTQSFAARVAGVIEHMGQLRDLSRVAPNKRALSIPSRRSAQRYCMVTLAAMRQSRRGSTCTYGRVGSRGSSKSGWT